VTRRRSHETPAADRALAAALVRQPHYILQAVDPSKPGNNTGVASFHGGRLQSAYLWPHNLAPERIIPHVLLIELPCVYPGARDENPNDLIQVARAVGQWEHAATCARVVHVYPRTWKSQVPKKIHNARTLAKLSPEERALVDGARHDVIDAVGLGLWLLGR
jgi:hypothetical protein